MVSVITCNASAVCYGLARRFYVTYFFLLCILVYVAARNNQCSDTVSLSVHLPLTIFHEFKRNLARRVWQCVNLQGFFCIHREKNEIFLMHQHAINWYVPFIVMYNAKKIKIVC